MENHKGLTLLPKPSTLDDRGGAGFNGQEQQPSKRRRIGMACEHCRGKKAKCDGARPTCSKCAQSGQECAYPLPEGMTHREDRKRRMEEMSMAHSNFQSAFELLRHGTDAEVADVVNRIRRLESLEEAVNTLAGAERLLSARRPSLESTAAPSPLSARNPNSSRNPGLTVPSVPTSGARLRLTSRLDHPDYVFEEHWSTPQPSLGTENAFVDLPSATLPVSRWTTVSNDDKLLNHLLRLFWTWDTYMNRVIDRTLFEEDLQLLDPSTEDNRTLRFCSPFLVNGLLALGCLYTTQDVTFGTAGDVLTRGKPFVDEAKRVLKFEENKTTLTLFQGIAMLYTYDGLLAPRTNNLEYMNRMVHIFQKLQADGTLGDRRSPGLRGSREEREFHALSWIQWGFYTLDWKVSVVLGKPKRIKKPKIAKAWRNAESCPMAQKEHPDYWWYNYPVSLLAQPSLKREIFEAECSLAEIVEEIVDFLYVGGIPPAQYPKKAVQLYNKVINWKYTLPNGLEAQNAILPAALMLHVGADDVFITLLRPYMHLSKSEFGLVDPMQASLAHAQSMTSTFWIFRAHYTARNEYWALHTSSVAAFLAANSLTSDALQLDTFIRACQILNELSERIPIGKDVLRAIRSLTSKLKVRIPQSALRQLSLPEGTAYSEVVGMFRAPFVKSEDGGPEDAKHAFSVKLGELEGLALLVD